MQNSLERILEGIAHALHADVLPELTDPYARSQVTAAIELLANLSTRVGWSDYRDARALAELSDAVADGGDDPDLRRAMLSALDEELVRLRSARYGKEPS